MALHKLGKLEALLFASGQPLSLEKMCMLILTFNRKAFWLCITLF